MPAPHSCTTHSGHGLRLLRAAVFAAVCVVLAAAGHTLAACVTVPLWALAAGFLGSLVLVAPLAGRERSLPGIAALLALGQTVLHTLFGLSQRGTGAAGSMAMPMPTASTPSASSMPDSVSGLTDAALVERAAHLVCGAGAAAISPARAYRILTDARLVGATGTSASGTARTSGATDLAGMAGMRDMSGMHHAADVTGSSMSLLPSLPMLLGHVLAALCAGWLLRRGDLALLRLIRLSAHGVAETALVRSLRAAFVLVRALRAGLPAGPVLPRPRRAARDEAPAVRTPALQHSVIRRGPPAGDAHVLAA